MIIIKFFLVLFLNVSKSDAHQIKVAVVDTGVSPSMSIHECPKESADFTGSDLLDRHNHGTMISSTIEEYNKNSDYCQVIVKWRNRSTDPGYLENALDYVASLDDIDIVNISAGGIHYSKREHDALIKLRDKNVVVIVAAGNEGQNLDIMCNYYPACLKLSNVYVVGNLGDSISKANSSNYGKRLDFWEQGGDKGYTSKATAIITGKVIRSLDKVLKRLGK